MFKTNGRQQKKQEHNIASLVFVHMQVHHVLSKKPVCHMILYN